ncbi:d60ce641-8cb8-4027-99c2-b249f22b1a73 [Sclerotinia trifoliorum]|uniref:D60ce641-8cb8-4027-99c2-b249f22b1a73 n=1 Tax=Sclerotinia trifoliorum TaxID=28548 RepID=A0A8H2ZPR7_9HELO|nr:d60ce641-8cb8-4027-99c2-b249f22b1a73 [Sclerotinia trifoliorum]
MEHLDVSFAQLEFQKYDLEEREIATILFEVLKGVAYVSSLRLSCRDLSQENIWLSLDGDIKLVLDPQELKHDDDEKWSRDAIEFISCTLQGSFESLMNHCFLKQAVSPRRLIPRIRFAYEAERGSWNSNTEKEAFDFDFVTAA